MQDDQTRRSGVFLYGPFLAPELLALANPAARPSGAAVPARLPGWRLETSDDAVFPHLVEDAAHSVDGLFVACADPWQLPPLFSGFDILIKEMPIIFSKTQRLARIPSAPKPAHRQTVPWQEPVWRARHLPFVAALLRERVWDQAAGATTPAAPLAAHRRALAANRATAVPPIDLRSDFGPGDIQDLHRSRVYSGFFALDTLRFRHRRYDGALSPTVEREVFVSGDAVSVLPWDPQRDHVLLIEQIRAGLLARGEANPWNLEVIAGLVDRREAPEAAARREAAEEADLTLGRMETVAEYYSSPGAMTEFLTAFIAEADLDRAPGVHGLASEAEDIRTLVLPFETAMAAARRGEVRNAPALLLLLALAERRAALRKAWR